jgi:hypothetical protein
MKRDREERWKGEWQIRDRGGDIAGEKEGKREKRVRQRAAKRQRGTQDIK